MSGPRLMRKTEGGGKNDTDLIPQLVIKHWTSPNKWTHLQLKRLQFKSKWPKKEVLQM